jgi:hypothetical protein
VAFHHFFHRDREMSNAKSGQNAPIVGLDEQNSEHGKANPIDRGTTLGIGRSNKSVGNFGPLCIAWAALWLVRDELGKDPNGTERSDLRRGRAQHHFTDRLTDCSSELRRRAEGETTHRGRRERIEAEENRPFALV